MESNTTRTIVPALAGWYVALFIEGDKASGDHFALDSIIAWEIEREDRPYRASAGRPGERCVSHYPMPITLEGNTNNMANQWAIKTPDGKFEFVGDQTCDNESAAVALCRSRVVGCDRQCAVS